MLIILIILIIFTKNRIIKNKREFRWGVKISL